MSVVKTVLKHEIIKTNSVNLHVVQAGPDDGQLLILLHGFPEFWYGWRNQIDTLAEMGLRLWIPDQRGYNLSDKPEGLRAYRVGEMATDVVGLIKAAGEEKAVVIGHDWGAMVTWWMALLYPEYLEKIAILNVPHPHIFQKTLTTNMEQFFKSWYAGFFQIPFLPEFAMSAFNWQPFARGMQQSANKGAFTDADMAQYKQAWSQPGAMTAMLNWYRAYVQHPPQDAADWRIPTPTLMIWGANDFALSRSMVQPSIDLCDNGELHIIEDATHWVQHDAPEQVNQYLTDFLK